MYPESWPGRFGAESGDVLVGLVQLCDGLWSNELLGRDVETVGVALHRLEQPGRWVVELAQHAASGDRRLIAGDDPQQRLGRVRGEMVSGRITVWGSPSPTTWR